MCGRFTSLLSPELISIIRELFNLPVPDNAETRYNIAPTQKSLVVNCREDDQNRIDMMRWGLIPSWAKDTTIGSHTINARCETVAEKPAFRHAIKFKRCIIPASGFYEWAHATATNQPYYIHMADGSIMGFAGLWEGWKDPEGNIIESFTIITTTANKLLEPIHDRMPVLCEGLTYV